MNINKMAFFHHFMIFRNFLGGVWYKLRKKASLEKTLLELTQACNDTLVPYSRVLRKVKDPQVHPWPHELNALTTKRVSPYPRELNHPARRIRRYLTHLYRIWRFFRLNLSCHSFSGEKIMFQNFTKCTGGIKENWTKCQKFLPKYYFLIRFMY